VSPSPAGRAPDDTLFRVGAVLIGVGVVASLVTVAPFLVGGEPLPLGAYLLALLAPLGLGVVLIALWLRARSRRSRLEAAASDAEGGDGESRATDTEPR
jgi:membrane protein implicated in regulation of membrane protease activity